MIESFRKITESALVAYCFNNESLVRLQPVKIKTSETEWSTETDPLYAPDNIAHLEDIEMVDYVEDEFTIIVTFEGKATGGTYRMTYAIADVSIMQIMIKHSIQMKHNNEQMSRELLRRHSGLHHE